MQGILKCRVARDGWAAW